MVRVAALSRALLLWELADEDCSDVEHSRKSQGTRAVSVLGEAGVARLTSCAGLELESCYGAGRLELGLWGRSCRRF